MSWFSKSPTADFDDKIAAATSESIPFGENDLAVALEITDLIRSKSIAPKDAMRCLKKRLSSTTNPNTQLSTLRLIELCVKNGGNHFLVEIASREFMDYLESLCRQSSDDVQDMVLKLIQEWALAFKGNFQLAHVEKVYQKLQNQGYSFPPVLNDHLNTFFDSKAPPEWVDSDACMLCSSAFGTFNRKHHCRSCGGVFCQDHSSKYKTLTDLGILEPVRVCDNCYEDYNSRKPDNKPKKKEDVYNEDSDLERAIQLSLQDIPDHVVEPVTVIEDSEDEDLKAAIALSLQESQRVQQVPSHKVYAALPQLPQQSYEITPADQDDILLFASLVEKMKSMPPQAILEDEQLQSLYRKVVGVHPKLNRSLNETVIKHDKLMDMNSKISEIMTMYDQMREQQLRNTHISYKQEYTPYPSEPQYQPTEYYRAEYKSPYTQPQHQEIQQHAYQTPYPQEAEPVPMQPTTPYPQESEPTVYGETHRESEPTVYPPQAAAQPSVQTGVQPTTPYPQESPVEPKITSFDFPTVPVTKVKHEHEAQEEAQEEAPKEELLIEL